LLLNSQPLTPTHLAHYLRKAMRLLYHAKNRIAVSLTSNDGQMTGKNSMRHPPSAR
jgi:hypothetical protein